MDWLDDTLVVSPTTLQMIGTLLIPGLVALVTKSTAVAWVKSTVNTVLAAGLAVVAALQVAPEGLPYRTALGYFVVSLVLSNLAYNVVWKPLGLWAVIQNWTSGFGLGGGGGTEQPLNKNIVETPLPGGVLDKGPIRADGVMFAPLADWLRDFGRIVRGEKEATPTAGAPIVSSTASAHGHPIPPYEQGGRIRE